MKLFKTIAAVALFAFSTVAMAQAPQGGQRQGMSSSDRAKRTVDQISEAVGLSAEQKAKVLEVSLKNAKADSLRMVEMRNQGGGQNMDFEAMRAENQKRTEARDAEIKALLNDAQKAKFDEYVKNRPQGRGGFGGGQGGGNR